MPDFPLVPCGRAHDVLCVGTALIDHLSSVPFELVEELELEIGTMTLIDSRSRQAIARLVGQGSTVSGGTVANTAVGIASLGGSPAYLGSVADDALGARYEEDLINAGVTAFLQRIDGSGGEGTGVCYVLITPDAERTMATNLGVSGLLGASTIDEDLVASAALIYIDGYLLDFPEFDAIIEQLRASSRAARTLLAVGLADRLVVERHYARLSALIAQADLVLCNESEALALARVEDYHQALRALAAVAPIAVMTRGANGALLATSDDIVAVDVHSVEEVRDLTGAGDLFASGVCYGITHGYDLLQAGRLGALCAAEAIGHVGARPVEALSSLAERAGLFVSR